MGRFWRFDDLVAARVWQCSGACQRSEVEAGKQRIMDFNRANPLCFLSCPFKGIDSVFPLRLSEFDSGHPFGIRNHFTGNGPISDSRRQHALKNNSADPYSPENLQHSSPAYHKSSLRKRMTGLESLYDAAT